MSEGTAAQTAIEPGLHEAPTLQYELEPWRRRFGRNLADLVFRREPPPLELTSEPGPVPADIFVDKSLNWWRIAESYGGHIAFRRSRVFRLGIVFPEAGTVAVAVPEHRGLVLPGERISAANQHWPEGNSEAAQGSAEAGEAGDSFRSTKSGQPRADDRHAAPGEAEQERATAQHRGVDAGACGAADRGQLAIGFAVEDPAIPATSD